MKRYKIFLLLLFAISAASAQTLIEQANAAYTAKDYQKAIQLYEIVINKNGQSAAIYYNLGNAWYRLKRTAPAILNYERALLLEPGNRNIRFNLEIARLKTVDVIEPINSFFLIAAFNAVKNLCGTDQWSYLAVICFVIFTACLSIYCVACKAVLKKIGFYTGLVFLIISCLANVFAKQQKNTLTHRQMAIIFSARTTIKSAPDKSGTDLFILHEGTKVKVINRFSEWNEIETIDGNIGWIRSREMEII